MTERSKIFGVVVGIVTDLNDPDNLARVRVKFPWLGEELSNWARLSLPMAGKSRGSFFRPEVEDEVLVAFEHGDPRFPYILGSLWNGVDQPPADDGQKTKNNWRFIHSRSGHVLRFDDTAGAEKIEIIDKDGSRRIVIDSAKTKIQILCDGVGDIEVKATAGNVTIQAASNITIKAAGTLSLEAAGATTIKGATVAIN